MQCSFWNTAGLIALSHLILVLLTRGQMFMLPGIESSTGLAIALLFGQFETLIVISMMLVPLWWAIGNRYLRPAYGLLPLACNAYVLLNAVFYQVFYNHFQLSYSEGRIANTDALWDSFLSEAGFPFVFSLMVLVLLQWVISRRLLQPHIAPSWSDLTHRPRLIGAGITVFLISALCSYLLQPHNLVSHPMMALLIGSTASESHRFETISETAELKRLRFGLPSQDPKAQQALAAAAEKLRSRTGPPNIVLVTIESVGSKQMFRRGGFDPAITPNLDRLAGQMLIFRSLYTPFPGTARSHVPLSSGGRTITWGSVFTELNYPYTGPTIEASLKDAGYRTALFSATDIDYENLDDYYRQQPYDKIFEPAVASQAFRDEHSVNSWGVDERAVLDKSLVWVKEKSDTPFFVHFRTVCTHHPYCAPPGFEQSETDRKARYYNSLRFIDALIGNMIKQLEEAALLENTMLFIVGDHGQAFGEYHSRNFTHKNYLYEENVKTFLLILDAARISEPVVVDRPGSLGDIMPTLLSIVGSPSVDVPGLDLFSDTYSEQIQYFHKGANPAQWGLRDGDWKFISRISGDFKPELYNLKEDPDEQVNLAAHYPERVQLYRNLCGNWYIRTNDEFVSYLEGFEYVGDSGLTLEQTLEYGPKRLAFGIKPEFGAFQELALIHPLESVVAWTHGVPYPEDKTLIYEWMSPSKEMKRISFNLKKTWSTAWIGDSATEPREEGQWQLKIRDRKGVLLEGSFSVSSDADLHRSVHHEGLLEVTFGVKPPKGEFEALSRIHPDEDMVAHAVGTPYSKDRRLLFRWTAPSGKVRAFYFTVKQGWNRIWVKHSAHEPMESGRWRLQILDQDESLVEGDFLVDQQAPLYRSIR